MKKIALAGTIAAGIALMSVPAVPQGAHTPSGQSVAATRVSPTGSGLHPESGRPTGDRIHPAKQPALTHSWLRVPLDFEANRGQAPAPYAFIAHGPGYVLGVSRLGLALSLSGRAEGNEAPVRAQETPQPLTSDLRLTFVNAVPKASVAGIDSAAGTSNYFLGNDPAQWRTQVPHYQRVRIASVWDGIDLMLYGNQQRLEYDFDVAAGADPQSIRLRVGGARTVRLDAAGDAVLHSPAGDVELKRPVAYQEVGGKRVPVESRFRVTTGREIAFVLGEYDRQRPLVIDPVLDLSVAFGGSNGNQAIGMALDSSGNMYVTGNTCSADFPATAGNFQSIHTNTTARDCQDAFVTKIDPTGATLLFSDFIGGSGGASSGMHVAADSTGVYVAGGTNAASFPTVANIGPAGTAPCGLSTKGNNCPEGFVLKLSPDGSQLLFSSLLGGTQASGAYQVKLNPVTGDLDVVGETNASDFEPAPTTLQTTFPGGSCTGGDPCFSGFLLGLNPATGALRYGTFLGGSGNNWISGLAFDKSGNIYVDGSTQPPLGSALGSVTHTYAPAGGATAAGASLFVAKLNLAGNQLTPGYLTLVQGDADTGAGSVAVDGSGNAYFGGSTAALHLPVTSGVLQTTNKNTFGNDCLWATAVKPFLPSVCGTGLVGKLDATGALSFLTYLGGGGQDYVESVATDSGGNLWLTGVTSSTDFPVSSDHYVVQTGFDAPFLAQMSSDGKTLPFASLIGGTFGQATDLAIDGSNNIYVAGFGSPVASTPGVYPENPMVFIPAFVQKWSAGGAPSISVSTTGLSFPDTAIGAVSAPMTATVQNTGTVAAQLGLTLTTQYQGIQSSDFLESSDCGTSLAAGASCTITVSFAPGLPSQACINLLGCQPTQRASEILINTNAIQGQQIVYLAGTAAVGPSMNVLPSPITFPAQAAGTASQPAYVTVESTGDATLTISNIALGGTNASDFQLTTTGVGGPSCTDPVPTGVGCNLTVTFSPPASATGTRTTTLTFTDTAGDSPQVVNITGTVAGTAALNISPLTLQGGTFPVAFGTSSFGVLNLQNPSATNDIQVTSFTITGTNAADFAVTQNNCSTGAAVPFTVAKGTTCYLNIAFAPTGTSSGLRTATLTVGTNPAIPDLPTVSLWGDAVTNTDPGMKVQTFPDPMNFGGLQVGEASNTASVLFNIYNNPPIPCANGASTCGAPLIISAIQFGLSDYTIVGAGQNACTTFPATIASGSTCTLAVAFKPSQVGSRATTMTITSNDPQGPVQLPIGGTGLALPLGVLLQTALNFGNSAIGVASPPLTTTLENTGQANLTIANIATSANFAVLSNTCNGSLAPQATCTISVAFTPPSAGFFSGTLTITDNDGFTPTQTVTLTGTGAAGPQLRLSPPVLDFGNQPVNTLSAPQTMTLTSTGDTTLNFPANALRSSADFILQSTTCGSSLAPGANCTASVQFKPTTTGFPESGTLLVTDNATGSPQPLFMEGVGVASTTTGSTTTVSSSANPAQAGQSVTFTATVSGPSGSTTVPTGSVTFLDGTTTLMTANVNAGGQATYTLSSLTAGSHAITAVYGGDTTYSGSTSGVLTEVVTSGTSTAATSTTLTSSANPSAVGQSVTFTATVAGPSGETTVPTGTVTFFDGSTSLGSGTLNSSAQATLSTAALASGSHSITAQYGGDANFSGSTSSALSQAVGAASFTVSVNPATMTVAAGKTGSTIVSVTPSLGFSQQVSFSCSGLPAASTCSFSPATVTPSGNTAVTTTLTVSTNVAGAMLTPPAPFDDPGHSGPTMLAVLLIGLGGLVRARRRWRSQFLVVLVLVGAGLISGCGGHSGSGGGGGGGGGSTTPPGTSTVTVTATAGTLTQTTTFTLTVQ